MGIPNGKLKCKIENIALGYNFSKEAMTREDFPPAN